MIDKWLEKGIDSFRKNQWFDGIQFIQGGLQRAFQSDQAKTAETIFKTTSELLLSANKQKLYCQIVIGSLPYLRKKIKSKNWVMVYPVIFSTLNNEGMKTCLNKFMNQLIAKKSFQEEEFIKELHALILKEKISLSLIC